MHKSNSLPLSGRESIPWDLLEVFMVTAHCKSIRQASDVLACNHSTVSRQINRLEQLLGEPVFERYKQGLTLTELGHNLMHYTDRMGEHFHDLERYLESRGDTVEGQVSLTMGDGLMPMIMPLLSGIQQQYPGLQLDISVSNMLAVLDKGEADVALRLTAEPPEHLIGHRLGEMDVAAYVSPKLYKQHKQSQVLADYPWVAWSQSGRVHNSGRAKAEALLESQRIVCRVTDNLAMLQAVDQHMGAAFMLSALAEQHGLQRISDKQTDASTCLWILYHPQMRRSVRVQAVVDALKEALLTR